MPAKSAKQYRLMSMCAHMPQHARGKCPSEKVSSEMIAATPAAKRSQWSRPPSKKASRGKVEGY